MIQPEPPVTSTELDKCFAELAPTIQNSINTASKNTFATFRVKRVKNPDPTSPQYIFKTTKDTTITQNIKKHLNKLRFLPEHENIVPVVAKGYQSIKKQVYVLSEYFQGSQSLAKVIENNKKISGGSLNSIFYQVIRAMKFLEENRTNHLRLNPSSILVKFPTLLQSTQNPVVRICDFGISAQNTANYFYKFCLHPHYFDPNRNIDTESYEDCVKYDLWALGAIIYYSFKQIKPFHGKESFFGNNMIFKTKHTLAPDSWLAKDHSYTITQSYLLERFIARCWGLKSKPVFKSWAEALQFYEKDYTATKMEKASIFDIYNNHVSLIFLLSKVYISLREELQYQITKIAQGPTSVSEKEKINSLSLFVFKFAHLYHTSQFQTHFINRCSVLSRHKRALLDQLKSYLESERLFLKQSFRDKKQYSFEYLVENVEGRIIEFKLRCKQIGKPYITPKVKFLFDFFDELLNEVLEAKKVLKDRERDRGELLNVFYKSQPLQKRAISCGLSIPKFSLIPQE